MAKEKMTRVEEEEESSETTEAPPKKAKTTTAKIPLLLTDRQCVMCHVKGVDEENRDVELTHGILTVESSNMEVVEVKPGPDLNAFLVTAIKPGTAQVTAMVMWANDKFGPFAYIIPVKVTSSEPVGLAISCDPLCNHR